MNTRGNRGRRRFEQPQDAHRINGRITAKQVRVVAEDGEQLGVLLTSEALKRAEEAGLDLVEVAPKAKPPVCKLLDYGKYKYKEQKKLAEARKNRTEISVKELRIRYRTDVGDMATKLKKARGFLEDGDKVKFSMRFRGREIVYMDLGLERFKELATELEDIADIDERSPRSGRQIYIIFAPKKGGPVKPEKAS